MPKAKSSETYLVLVNIRSVANVGAIFRTADAVGVSEIFLVGYTPAPIDRFGRPRRDFAKVSLGAERTVAWRRFGTFAGARRALQARGAFIVAIEQSPKSLDYKKVKVRYPAAFVVGNETAGLPRGVLAAAHRIAEISMGGKKESLNVSVALGIALFRMLGR